MKNFELRIGDGPTGIKSWFNENVVVVIVVVFVVIVSLPVRQAVFFQQTASSFLLLLKERLEWATALLVSSLISRFSLQVL